MFEILSTASMVGVWGASFYFSKKETNKDHEKIVQIADALGLKTKDHSIRIYRKRKHKNYTEYVYKIPLGLSFKQFQEQTQTFVDGLNNKSRPDLKLSNFKNIQFNRDILKQIQDAFNHRTILDKHIEMEYDGMLRFRVYEEGLDKLYHFEKRMLENLKSWEVPIGVTYKQFITHNFEKRPHMIIAGQTGFGKSEIIKLLVASLTTNKPEHVRFHLIDLKGGTELGVFRNMKQVVNFGRNVVQAKEILKNIQERMDNVLDKLFEDGLKDVKDAGQKEREFIFIDEAADLDDDCKEIVTDIARRGRSAGFRLIYATQYPTNETLPSQVRANIGSRIAFRLETSAQSRATLDENGAEELPEIEGRAIFRRIKNHLIQTPLMDKKTLHELIKPHLKEGERASYQTKKPSKTRENPFELKEL